MRTRLVVLGVVAGLLLTGCSSEPTVLWASSEGFGPSGTFVHSSRPWEIVKSYPSKRACSQALAELAPGSHGETDGIVSKTTTGVGQFFARYAC